MFNGLMGKLLLPVLLLWSLCYGVVGGMFFKMLALYENWIDLNRLQIIQWKRYPQRSYNKYTSAILSYRMSFKPIELVGVTNGQIQSEYRCEPFPLIVMLTNTLITLLIAPFIIASGAILGPLFVFRHTVESWRERGWLRI